MSDRDKTMTIYASDDVARVSRLMNNDSHDERRDR